MEIILLITMVYLSIGVWLTMNTRSRGMVADAIFILLWPLYWFDDWKNGRLK
jgi:hypothetical protein